MKNFIYIFIILICLMFFTTCKKYPEDRFASLKNPSKRIAGRWEIYQYQYNGNSIINELNAKLQTITVSDIYMDIDSPDLTSARSDKRGYMTITSDHLGGFHDFPIGEKRKHDQSTFYIDSIPETGISNKVQCLLFLSPMSFKGKRYENWSIRKLYKNQMHLQLSTDSGNYDIYLKNK